METLVVVVVTVFVAFAVFGINPLSHSYLLTD